MIAITKLIMIGIAIVCLVTLTFVVQDFVENKVKSKSSKKRNRVRFYVARDKHEALWLYLGKPTRKKSGCFASNKHGSVICSGSLFKHFGLDINNYKDLKWEDEPIEVFLNMED